MGRLIDIDDLKDPYEGTSQEGGWVTNLLAVILAKAPRADAEYIRHAHWKIRPMEDWGASNCKCSACGYEDFQPMALKGGLHKYCPDCGAKMDEVTW